MIGKWIAKSADNNRRAIKMSITDKYDEGNVWITVFWIKYRWFIVGLLGGLYLQYAYNVVNYILEWLAILDVYIVN